jgi:uncharacterized protein (TIGR02611 family)
VRGAAKRVAVETAGWILVVAGIAALILPGPGLLMLAGGLAILSQQYEWAERRMRPVEIRAKKAAADGVQTVPRIVMSTLFSLGLVALGVLWVVDPAAPSWWPVRESWWLIGGWATGSTLIASGVIALALIVWSIKHFRGVDDPRAKAERLSAP